MAIKGRISLGYRLYRSNPQLDDISSFSLLCDWRHRFACCISSSTVISVTTKRTCSYFGALHVSVVYFI